MEKEDKTGNLNRNFECKKNERFSIQFCRKKTPEDYFREF